MQCSHGCGEGELIGDRACWVIGRKSRWLKNTVRDVDPSLPWLRWEKNSCDRDPLCGSECGSSCFCCGAAGQVWLRKVSSCSPINPQENGKFNVVFDHHIRPRFESMPRPLDAAARAALGTMCRQCARSATTKQPTARLPPSMSRTIHSGKTARPATRATDITRTQGLTRSSSGIAQAASLFGHNPNSASDQQPSGERVLREDQLFNSYTNSPIPRIRQRAAFMRQHAYCPCPDHQPTRLSESGQPLRQSANTSRLPPAHVDFECPDCGVPVYCSQEHWVADYEAHLQVCDTLKQINEDDHDLHSGRFFPEFEYAGPQLDEAMVNMTNWDTFLYTRAFKAVDSDRSMRQATRMLTYPVTVGSILHELSPYSLRQDSRLTPEGLKSLSGEFCKRRQPF